ncbi:MAG: DUF1232 domain-containing protein [Candidatus Cloacimonetes bacterium]|jgi:uncharacterized membrane protein YkvA (DUF1232 family)|nr:DUF1232 domain-containing protein [Candidatus Cloacimonadota bacterium]MDD4155289.1 DUF1232 domain-containing protein [Candidatus Cloacimonadota bacterium]
MFDQDDKIYDSEEIDEEKLKNIADKVINDEDLKFKFYEKLRKKLSDKLPNTEDPTKLQLKDFLFFLPDFFILVTRLFLDKRIPSNKKVLVASLIGYSVMPIDLIPDFIPIIGYIDDLVIMILGLDMLLKDIDEQILIDNWPGNQNVISLIRMIIEKIESNIQDPLFNIIKRILRRIGS